MVDEIWIDEMYNNDGDRDIDDDSCSLSDEDLDWLTEDDEDFDASLFIGDLVTFGNRPEAGY